MRVAAWWITAAMAGALTGILAGCGPGAKKEEADVDAPAPVQVSKVEAGQIQHIVSADAILYPVAQSAISPKISAPVRRFLVNRGDHVKQGQLLAELEDRDLAATASESKALYEQAQSQYLTTTSGTLPEDMVKAQTDVESARQSLEAAKKLYDNRVTLVREGALAQKLADDANVALVQAQSLMATAQRHLESLRGVSRESQIKAAQSQVDAAKARLASSEVQAGYAQVRSPIAGVVADRPISAGEIAGSGNALITIVDISAIVARANVPAREVGSLRAGQTATIMTAAGEATGKVTVVSPALDPSSTTVEVWVQAPNPGEKMKPGVTARVAIRSDVVHDALVIPTSALLSSEEGNNEVMVVGADSIAHERKVETGIREGDRVEVSEGLKAGEAVITGGGLGLADKAKVKIQAAGKDASIKDTDKEE